MSKRLFVGGLPYSLTENELKEIFEKIGKVISCSLISDKYTNQSKGFAFVEMDTNEDVSRAIKELDGTEVGGRKMIVNVAKPREEHGGGYGGNNYQKSNRGSRNYSRNDKNRGFKRY